MTFILILCIFTPYLFKESDMGMFSALMVSWFLSFGYIPQQTEVIYNNEDYVYTELSSKAPAIYTNMGFEANLGSLKVWTELETYCYTVTGINYYPFRSDYVIGSSLNLGKNIQFVAEHECDHAVEFLVNTSDYNRYMSFETKMYIKVGNRL